MPHLYVCPLSQIAQKVEETGARSLVTFINVGTPVVRPPAIAAHRHVFVGMSDILKPQDGHVLPGQVHVQTLLDFMTEWDRNAPVLIHCYAGVSRSTAAAFISACALNPARDEHAIAQTIRTLSPTATPNAKLVEVADAMLKREGRMIAAIAAIGRGEDCYEGVPFALSLQD